MGSELALSLQNKIDMSDALKKEGKKPSRAELVPRAMKLVKRKIEENRKETAAETQQKNDDFVREQRIKREVLSPKSNLVMQEFMRDPVKEVTRLLEAWIKRENPKDLDKMYEIALSNRKRNPEIEKAILKQIAWAEMEFDSRSFGMEGTFPYWASLTTLSEHYAALSLEKKFIEKTRNPDSFFKALEHCRAMLEIQGPRFANFHAQAEKILKEIENLI
jgi:hypothetical protein